MGLLDLFVTMDTSCSSLSPFPKDHCSALLLTRLREKGVWEEALKTMAIAVNFKTSLLQESSHVFQVSLDGWGHRQQCEHNRRVLSFTNSGYK